MATTGHRFGFNRRADIAGRTGAASAARRHCRLAAGALAVALEPDVRLPPSGSPRAHGVVRMSSRAARAGSEVPAPLRRHLDARKRRAVFTGDLPPTNHATYSLDLFAPWTALRSSWWVVIPMTTTGPPPRPGGNSGRCAAPTLAGSAGTAGALPTLTHTPFGSVAAQLLPRGHRRALPQPSPRTRPPDQKRAGETAPSENNDRASQQPIAASFRAGDEHRGFHHWYRFPCALLPANGPGPLAADRFLHRRGPLAARRRTSGRSCPPTSPHSYGGRGLSPGHMAPHGAVPLASEAVGKRAA
jgi:hypothetical protein